MKQISMRHQKLTASHIIQEAAATSLQVELAPVAEKNTRHADLPFGAGQVYLEELQPGLLCELHELHCHSDVEFECAVDSQISCSITLDGKLDGIDLDGYGQVESRPHHAILLGFGEPSRWIRRLYNKQYFKTFGVTLKPAFFERFAESFGDRQLSQLKSYRIGQRVKALPFSQRLVTLGNNAFNHSYTGGLASLYQESNTLQFVLEVIQLLREENRLVRKMGRAHYERLMQARSILDNSLVAPPKTLDLARQVGTNITTLQAHFKLALGTTIFGYVKSQRLEMARVLLIEHQLAVAETAFRVGFSSPSAFAASYRKYFGCSPSVDVGE